MDQKYGEFVGVDSVYIADVTMDNNSSYVTGIPVYLAPVAEIAGTPEINNNSTYYDNQPGNNYVTEGKTELKVVVSNIPAHVMADILGKDYDVATGRVLDDGQANPPAKALGFRYNMGKNGFRYYWYLNGTFSGGAEEAATKTADVDVKTYELTYTAINTTHEFNVNGVEKTLKRIFGDTSDSAFNPTGWFTQVQTPGTVGAPATLALSTSTPVDGATGVSVSANLTMTFNNAIDSYAVTLINPTTLAVIAATISLDTAKKILTINPDGSLVASTEYAIIASKVTDVYGQDLKNIVINFTTA